MDKPADGHSPTILLVDDDVSLLRLMQIRLRNEGFRVDIACNGEEALAAIDRKTPQLVITDLKMPGLDGMGLLQQIQRRYPSLPVILLTAHGTIPDAVTATRSGALDFMTKPVDKLQLLRLVRKALQAAAPNPEWDVDIVSGSPAMAQLVDDARQIALGDASVLITGESGTGKELLARAIHRASRRRERPFVAINCGALPADLLESELFGHEKGAFTGAVREHHGLIRSAEGGSLLLDEIGDMPAMLQVKLLRVLEERVVRPVGGTQSLPFDVRVLAATHRDLKAAIARGAFREDLYYRLNVVSLRLPTLAERAADIPALVGRHLQRIAARKNEGQHVFAPEAMELLVAAQWPGNVRQLLNVVEQTVALSPTPVVSAHIVRKALGDETVALPTFSEAREAFTRSYLTQLLNITNGNVSRAAKLAERNRTELYKLFARYSLEAKQFKKPAGLFNA